MAAAFVQDASNGATPVTSVAIAFASDVTAGNQLNVIVRSLTSDVGSWTITDTLLHTYVEDVTTTSEAGLVTIKTYRVSNCSGGANTVTFAGSGSQRRGIVVKEFSGLDTTSPLEDSEVNSGSGDTSVEFGSVTLAGDGLILIGWCYNSGQTTTLDTDYANLEENTTGRCGAANRVITGGITDAAINTASATVDFGAVAAGYKVPAAGGSTHPGWRGPGFGWW